MAEDLQEEFDPEAASTLIQQLSAYVEDLTAIIQEGGSNVLRAKMLVRRKRFLEEVGALETPGTEDTAEL